MRNTRKIIAGLVTAAALATVGATAYAFPGGGPGSGCAYGAQGAGPMGGGYGPGMGMMGGGPRGRFGPGMAGAQGNPAANSAARLAFLQKELGITADQESAWQAYAKQVTQQAESMQALRTEATASAKTAPERLNQRAAFAKQRATHMESMSVALNDLYAVLTPEQKAVADQHFGGGRMAQGGPRGYGRGR